MYIKRKNKIRIAIVVLLILVFIFWRGFKNTTQGNFDCQYKILYAACTAKGKNAKLPSIMEIFKAGVKF
jgi:hypothetical protein